MSGNEWFSDIIEFDGIDIDFNEENTPSSSKRMRTPRTTMPQFKKMSQFMNSHNKKTLGRRAFEDAWDVIVSELNELGPPFNTSEKWKKIWFDYKSRNKKPKLSSVEHISHPGIEIPTESQTSSLSAIVNKHTPSSKSSEEKLKAVENVLLMTSRPKGHQTTSLSSHKKSETGTFQSNTMAKLDAINEETKKLSEYVKAMLTNQNKTNELLEKLLTNN